MRQVKVTKLSEDGVEDITFVNLPEKKASKPKGVKDDNGEKKQKKKRISKTS